MNFSAQKVRQLRSAVEGGPQEDSVLELLLEALKEEAFRLESEMAALSERFREIRSLADALNQRTEH